VRTPSVTRRQWLAYSLASSVTAVRAAQTGLAATTLFAAVERALVAQTKDDKLSVLTPGEAEEFAAIAARIVPTDDTPGATEAGAVFFIDRVLGSSRAELLPSLREGLRSLQAAARAAHGSSRFATLPVAQQDELLRQIERSAFFASVRYLTVCGTFASPEYGGNRDFVGWRMTGFDHRHVWAPPFGYYDADYLEKGE
jgi:gluconate 2-dehydrogenase gamma chain